MRAVLLVDPEDESIAVFRPDETRTFRGIDRLDLAEIIPGFALDVREVFDALHLD